MANLGVHVNEKATAVSTPVVATVGIPFVVGSAPINAALAPAQVNTPVLVTSWEEAVEKLGFSYDWKSYTLCEFMYSHFKLYGCQPVVFCNVLNPKTMKKEVSAADHTVDQHKVTLPFMTINDKTLVVQNEGKALVVDEDYSVLYDENAGTCVVELLESGNAYNATTLNIKHNEIDSAAVVVADIVEGLEQIDACMTKAGLIPDLICAPGWSHNTVVAAIMATKAAGINSLFGGKALIDCDTSENGVREYSALTEYKNKNNFVDENQIVCWPMVKLGGYMFHMSTQTAGLMAQVDTINRGVPYESPSNKNLQIDGCCLEDGTEVNLTWNQVNLIAGSWGVVTAINFMSMGWTAKGNYTACYPGNTDIKDQFIPVSRMFDFIRNTLVRTFWSKQDKPMNRRLVDSIVDTCNIWLNGLTNDEFLLGARVVVLDSENPLTDLMNGIIRFHIYIAPPGPAQEIDFTLEYDVSYLQAAFAA